MPSRRRLARGNRLQENEGEVSPCPSLLRARIKAAASPQHTQSETATLSPDLNRIPRKCQTHGHASVPALRSPLRGFAEFFSTSTPPAQRFPPVLLRSANAYRRSLTPLPEKETPFPLPINGTLLPCRHRLRPCRSVQCYSAKSLRYVARAIHAFVPSCFLLHPLGCERQVVPWDSSPVR